ncbi:MAG TPA: SMP-30/gluconolactonase/LRE family protein [Agromyces sp.]|nr:SMP-30/gluconolactonase/LRE family protein [Agromyces sp.]
MRILKAIPATPEPYDLAEGPVWDPVRHRLLWVDIPQGLVLSGDLEPDGTVSAVARFAFPGTVGAIAIAPGGEWIVAGASALLIRTADGHQTPAQQVIPGGVGRRLNDGKVDPVGRFVVGSLRLDGASDTEVLARIEDDGRVTVLDDDLTLSNGLGWTADGSRMYSVDTMRRVVFARRYDPVTGEVGPREEWLTFADGFPDGMCLDAEEHLWIAMWGLGRVHRYTPDGELVAIVEVPAPHTSSVAFAGAELDTLVVTTATQDLTASQRAEFPHSGKLFTVRPGVPGLPQPFWNGRSAAAVTTPTTTNAPR